LFARLLAAFCLLHLAVGMSRAASDGPANSELLVYLRADSSRPIEYMKHELAPLMATAGFHLAWRDSDRTESNGALAVMQLRGTCGMPAGKFAIDPGEPKELASAAVSEDAVLPFITVNCTGLTRLLAPALMQELGARRDYLDGRALARVRAHELYHVLANTREHARDGIGKPVFSAADLLDERFDFEPATRSKMESSTVTSSDAPSGR
jgi:hypothetical protein